MVHRCKNYPTLVPTGQPIDQVDKEDNTNDSDTANKKVITENESVSGDPEETNATAKFEIPATGCASSKIPKYISKSKLKFSIKTEKKSSLIPKPLN